MDTHDRISFYIENNTKMIFLYVDSDVYCIKSF